MAVSIVEVVSNQTSADPGSLATTFAGAPIAGDVAVVFVAFEGTIQHPGQVSVSGLGASWRFVEENPSSNGQWLAVYEGTGVTAGSTITVTETYTGSISRFGMSSFLLRGTAGASPVYGLTIGQAANPPALSVTPLVAGDGVIGMWWQTNTTAPTVTTSPASGWTSGNQAVNGYSLQWRYIVSASTSAHTMDSNQGANYMSFGVASQAGEARVGAVGATVVATNSVIERRVSQVSLDGMTAPTSIERRVSMTYLDTATAHSTRKVSRVYVEVMMTPRPFIGWGVPV